MASSDGCKKFRLVQHPETKHGLIGSCHILSSNIHAGWMKRRRSRCICTYPSGSCLFCRTVPVFYGVEA